jgi:hypothetical protein
MLCPRLKDGRDFSISYTGMSYKSRYVVYLAACMQWDKQFVGKTTQHMHTRHVATGVRWWTGVVDLGNFSLCGIDEIGLQIIDCVKDGEDEAEGILEGFCQNMLATFQANENNINVRNEWTNCMGQYPIFLGSALPLYTTISVS